MSLVQTLQVVMVIAHSLGMFLGLERVERSDLMMYTGKSLGNGCEKLNEVADCG